MFKKNHRDLFWTLLNQTKNFRIVPLKGLVDLCEILILVPLTLHWLWLITAPQDCSLWSPGSVSSSRQTSSLAGWRSSSLSSSSWSTSSTPSPPTRPRPRVWLLSRAGCCPACCSYLEPSLVIDSHFKTILLIISKQKSFTSPNVVNVSQSVSAGCLAEFEKVLKWIITRQRVREW